MDDLLVDVAGLAKRYGGRPVVTGVTLRLRRGEVVGLVGANGGGKTTTLRMLAGLLRPDAGSGRVLGDDVMRPDARRRRHIGYLGQRLALYPELSVTENLRFHGEIHGLTDAPEQIARAVERFGLTGVLAKRFGDLSGGWARRVQFAASVLHAPPLLLLDEPSAGLDVVTKAEIWRWIGEMAAAGQGVVISTHDLVEAERCATIVPYQDGRALAQVAPLALVAEYQAASLEDAVVALAGRELA